MPKTKKQINFNKKTNFIYENLYQYKSLSRVLGRRTKDLINLIDLFEEKKHKRLHEKNDRENKIVFLSYTEIKKKLKLRTQERVAEDLGLFCYFGLIKKMPDNKIPERFLKESVSYQLKEKHSKHISYFSLTNYNKELFEIANTKAKELLKNGFRKDCFNRKYVLYNFGEDKANEIFPQFEEENYFGLSKEDIRNIEKVKSIVLEEIKTKKYIKEKNIVENKDLKEYWLIAKNRIIKENNLKCDFLKNDLRELLKIENEKGRPRIIFPNYILPKDK